MVQRISEEASLVLIALLFVSIIINVVLPLKMDYDADVWERKMDPVTQTRCGDNCHTQVLIVHKDESKKWYTTPHLCCEEQKQ